MYAGVLPPHPEVEDDLLVSLLPACLVDGVLDEPGVVLHPFLAGPAHGDAGTSGAVDEEAVEVVDRGRDGELDVQGSEQVWIVRERLRSPHAEDEDDESGGVSDAKGNERPSPERHVGGPLLLRLRSVVALGAEIPALVRIRAGVMELDVLGRAAPGALLRLLHLARLLGVVLLGGELAVVLVPLCAVLLVAFAVGLRLGALGAPGDVGVALFIGEALIPLSGLRPLALRLLALASPRAPRS